MELLIFQFVLIGIVLFWSCILGLIVYFFCKLDWRGSNKVFAKTMAFRLGDAYNPIEIQRREKDRWTVFDMENCQVLCKDGVWRYEHYDTEKVSQQLKNLSYLSLKEAFELYQTIRAKYE